MVHETLATPGMEVEVRQWHCSCGRGGVDNGQSLIRRLTDVLCNLCSVSQVNNKQRVPN